jgi:hypothetical protein
MQSLGERFSSRSNGTGGGLVARTECVILDAWHGEFKSYSTATWQLTHIARTAVAGSSARESREDQSQARPDAPAMAHDIGPELIC